MEENVDVYTSWWTLSQESHINEGNYDDFAFTVSNTGGYGSYYVDGTDPKTRPVITLKNDTFCAIGDGTQGNPYKI